MSPAGMVKTGMDNAPAPLMEGGRVTVEIAGVCAPGGDLAARHRDFAQRLAVTRHAGHDHQDVPTAGERCCAAARACPTRAAVRRLSEHLIRTAPSAQRRYPMKRGLST